MSYLGLLLWILTVVSSTAGQLCFKAASIADDAGVQRWRRMLTDKWLWLGISCFVVDFFLWMAFLSIMELGRAVFLGSLNIVTILVGGRVFFGEALTGKRLVASVLVLIGVGLVGWGS